MTTRMPLSFSNTSRRPKNVLRCLTTLHLFRLDRCPFEFNLRANFGFSVSVDSRRLLIPQSRRSSLAIPSLRSREASRRCSRERKRRSYLPPPLSSCSSKLRKPNIMDYNVRIGAQRRIWRATTRLPSPNNAHRRTPTCKIAHCQ